MSGIRMGAGLFFAPAYAGHAMDSIWGFCSDQQ
jgi:hypothetical protein